MPEAFFQHPDTGESCVALFSARQKTLTVTSENGEIVLRTPAATAEEAKRELVALGVDPVEAELE